MGVRAFVLLLAVVGCGRLGYDPQYDRDGGDAIDGGAIDAADPADANTFAEVSFSTQRAQITSIVFDEAGAAYVGGFFNGTLDIGDGTMVAAQRSGFLASFTAGGALRWSKHLDGAGDVDAVEHIVVLANGDIAVSGVFTGTVDFGGGDITALGAADIWHAQYTRDGSFVEVRQLGGNSAGVNDDRGRATVQSAAGDLFVVGEYSGAVDFGGGPVSSQAVRDIYILSTSADGQFRWMNGFGLVGRNNPFALAIDSQDNIYVTGFYEGNLDFGGGPLAFGGVQDAFVASFDSDGNHRWSLGTGGAGFDYATAMAIDAADNLYVAGHFQNTVDFGGGALSGNGQNDGFVISLSPNGDHRWSRAFGGSACDYGNGIAVGEDGVVYLAGSFTGSVDVAGTLLEGVGGRDGFIATIDPNDGAATKVLQFGGSGTDTVRQVAVASDGVWITTAENGTQGCSSPGSHDGDLLSLRRLPLGL